jgi:hypothetical protein
MDIRDILKSFDQLTEGDSTVHKAGPGGYGNRHGTDDVTDQYGKPIGRTSLAKMNDAPAVKRGKGRPPKNADSSGEVKSYDSSALSKAMGMGKAPNPKGKPSVKHSLKEYFDQMDGALSEAGLAVQPMPATPAVKAQQQMATKPSFMIKDPANPNMPAITTQDPAVVQAAKNGTMSMQKPGAAPGATPAAGAGSQVKPMGEGGDVGKHNNATTGFDALVRKLTPKYGKEAATKIAGSQLKKMKMHESQGVAEAAKWRSNPDAYDTIQRNFDTDPDRPVKVSKGDVGRNTLEKHWHFDAPLTARSRSSIMTKLGIKAQAGKHGPKGVLPEQGMAEGVNDDAMAGLQKTIDFAKQHGYKIYRSPTGRKMRFVNKTIDHEIRARVDNDGDSINVNYMDMTNGTSGNDDASYFDETFKRAYNEALSDYEYRMDDQEERTGMKEAEAPQYFAQSSPLSSNNRGVLESKKGVNPSAKKEETDKKKCPPMSHVKKMCQDGKSMAEICKMHPDCDQKELKQMVADCKKKLSEGAKPDFLDLDKDGNKKEPMKKAAADKSKGAAPKKGVNPFAKKKVKEGMEHNLQAARLEGKSHALRKMPYNCTHDDMEESRCYHDGFKEGLDECYGQMPILGRTSVGEMGQGPEVATMASYGADDMGEAMYDEGNAFTAGLAKTPHGGKFKVGGSSFTDNSRYDSNLDEFAFEALDKQLNAILEDKKVSEGMTVSISKGQQGSPDSVSVSAQDGEADQLLSIIKSAGMGLFGGDEQNGYGAPQGSAGAHGGINVVDDHDGMMALMKKLSGNGEMQGGGDYEDEEGSGEEGHMHGEEETCESCGGMMEENHQCESDEQSVMGEDESEDQMAYEVAETNAPDSGADNTNADVAGNAAANSALATADAGADEEEGKIYSSPTEGMEDTTGEEAGTDALDEEGYYKDPDGDEDSAEDKADKADHERRSREEEKLDEAEDETGQLDEISQELAVKTLGKRRAHGMDGWGYDDAHRKADATEKRVEKKFGKDAVAAADKITDKELYGDRKMKEETVAESFANLYKKLAFLSEESTSEKDAKAEKAGKKVAKDIEYDEGHKGKDDNKAEKAGKKVTKDIEYDDKKDKKDKKVDESYANSADDTFEADIDFMTKVITGGLNKQKSTGQTTIPVIAGQRNRMGADGLGSPMKESTDLLKDYMKLSGL